MMKGLSIPGSIPYFAIPSAAMAAAIYGSVPLLDRAGVPLAINVIAHFVLILGGLGVLALVLGARDDQQKLSRRMWLTAPRWTDIVLGILIGSFGLWLYNQLQVTDAWISNATSIKPPAWLDHLFANGKFLDLSMRGNWWLLVLFLVFYLCNVVGEELWALVHPAEAGARNRAIRLAGKWHTMGLFSSLLCVGHARTVAHRVVDCARRTMAPQRMDRHRGPWLPEQRDMAVALGRNNARIMCANTVQN